MKKILFFAAAMLLSVTLVQADVVINDPNSEKALFTIFNTYFADQLEEIGKAPYETSQDLFGAIGVKNPNTPWRTAGTQIVGGYGEAKASHALTLYNRNDTTSIPPGVPPVPAFKPIALPDDISESMEVVVFDGIPNGAILDLGLQTTFGGTQTVWSDASRGSQANHVNMIALDIKNLYNMKTNEYYNSVYMFAWEDLGHDSNSYDRDYQDVILIMTNLYPIASNVSPEPATLAVLGLGLVGVGLASRRRRK